MFINVHNWDWCSRLRLVWLIVSPETTRLRPYCYRDRHFKKYLIYILYTYHIMSNVWTTRCRRLEPVGKRHCRMLSNGIEGVQSWREDVGSNKWNCMATIKMMERVSGTSTSKSESMRNLQFLPEFQENSMSQKREWSPTVCHSLQQHARVYRVI